MLAEVGARALHAVAWAGAASRAARAAGAACASPARASSAYRSRPADCAFLPADGVGLRPRDSLTGVTGVKGFGMVWGSSNELSQRQGAR